jgi:hypothetical protein
MIASLLTSAMGGVLFVGLEGSAPPTYSSDLSGFPNVTWDSHFSFDVSGASATPDGLLYLCNGAFTTRLYEATLEDSPTLLSTISVDISGMAYGRDTLYGFSNYATPKGIYSIEPNTGQATLVLDVYTSEGFRFFALGYNPLDDMLYGYTEYGDYGLYSINIDTGEMIKLVGAIPASNGQGRGLAVGDNTVFLTATRGDDDIPFFAYDLTQGVGGEWVGFTQAYPAYHSTGAAAWIPSATAVDETESPGARMLQGAFPNPFNPKTNIHVDLEKAGQLELAVYSVDGQKVATIFSGQVDAGSREFVWDGSDVPSGVYQLRMITDEHAETLKLVLLK